VIALTLLLLAQVNSATNSEDLVQKLDATAGLKEKEKPFEIAASLGRLYFSQGRYADAQLYFKQAFDRAAAAKALYFAQKKRQRTMPSAVPGCEPTAENTLQLSFDKAQSMVREKNLAAAVACLDVALRPVMDVDVRLGQTQFLLGDAPGAISTFAESLQVFEKNVEARYALAATTIDALGEDVAALSRARLGLQQFLAEAPQSPLAGNAKRLLSRTEAAIAAGGFSKLAPAGPPPRVPGQAPVLTPEMIQAFQNAPRTPEMNANFEKWVADAEEHVARSRFVEALNAYKQVMPYQPENARLRAGMAWTMLKLNRQPMADNVWRVATESPDAVSAFGDTLKSKGDEEGAQAVWSRLKASVPSYAPQLAGKLK
jgi:tetratricopeptide (TPR) repeat protein